MAPVEELVLLDLDRSNKGASKQRRDQINAEINVLRDLLPLPESSRQRLSQLQVMSLSCVYIRKCNVLKKLFRSQSHEVTLPDSLDFFQAMTGFLLVTTREGKLIYISENVTDYLGHSMVDMKTQGDSLYDIVDKRDHGTVQAKLLQGGGALESKDIVSEDVSFFCRMNMSRTLKRQSGFGDVKVMHIQGHFVPVTNNTIDSSNSSSSSSRGMSDQQQYVFMASCSPLITPDLKENLVLNNTNVFKTVHQMDMAFMEITKMAEHHLGYTSDELFKTSWYSMIHPEDIQEAKEKHMQLVRSNHHEIGCMMTVRMLKADGSHFWVNIVMHVKQTLMSQNDEPFIVCINQIISAQEAYQIRMQGQMFSMYPGRVQELWGSHMPSVSSTQNLNVNVNQWIQQEGNNSVPVPGFPCSMPNYPSGQSRYPIMYPSAPNSACTASLAANMDRARKCGRGGVVGAPATAQYELPTLVQTDKLKAMLKRKIQGPTTVQSQQCRPVKVPKMSWNDVDGSAGSERKVYQELEPAPLHTHVLTEQFRNGEVRNVVEHSSGQVVQVMMATAGQPAAPVYLTKKSYPSLPEMVIGGGRSSRSDYTTTNISSHRVKMEQVVPDISVPDSFLTPDPSPISSPEPSSVVKTEVMDPDELVGSSSSSTTSSVCILQALEKLASQPQQGGLLSVKTELPSPTNTATTKQYCSGGVGGKAAENRELPIFDAFDIENFFDMLSPAANESKASIKVENYHEPCRAKASQGIQGIMQMPHLKPERSGLEVPSQSPPLDSRDSMAFLPSSMEVPMLQIKTEMKETEVPCFHSISTAASRKDIVVSSTMIQSPKSVGSQDTMTRCESLDDLLSCFSDEGLDLSPFQADPMNNSNNNNSSSRSEVDVAMCKFGSVKDPLGLQKMSSFDSICQVPVYPSSDLERGLEELSPQSTSSGMSREDDVMDSSSSVWSFGMELVDNLDSTASPQIADSPKHSADIKGQEEEMAMDDVFDQVHLLLDSLVPSQGSL